ILLLAVFAPWVAPHDPLEQDLLHMLTPPMWASGGSGDFPLGTDGLGRCVLSRAISYLVDLWMSFPPVVLSLILLVGLGTGVDKVILAVVLVDWTRFCRVI